MSDKVSHFHHFSTAYANPNGIVGISFCSYVLSSSFSACCIFVAKLANADFVNRRILFVARLDNADLVNRCLGQSGLSTHLKTCTCL